MATTIVTKKGSGAPAASDLVEGELAVDTTNGRLYTENSSAAVVELGSNPSGNITFGDNGKAIFGAGSDATLHSDGSTGYARGFVLQNTAGNKDVLTFVDGGATTLLHNNAAKLATTSTGIDVTGTMTATKLVSANGVLELDDNGTHNGVINSPASLIINIDSDANSTGEDFIIAKDRTSTSGGTELFRVQEDGNVGIGVTPTAYANYNTLAQSGTSGATLEQKVGSTLTGSLTADSQVTLNAVTAIPLVFKTTNTERLRIAADGSLSTPTAGTSNVRFGVNAGNSIASGGNYNVVVGDEAGTAITTGSNNTAAGYSALVTNNTGSGNTVSGAFSGYSNTTGGNNTASGFRALQDNTTGSSNVAIGAYALDDNTEASNNTAVGYAALGAVNTGASNVAFGKQAGDAITTGGGNVILGALADVNSASGNYANVIGFAVTGDAGYTTLGESGSDIRAAHGNVTWATVSDERYKKDIVDSEAGLSLINALRPRTFNYKNKGELPDSFRAYEEGSTEVFKSSQTQHGFIAQEVKAAIDADNSIKDGFKLWDERADGSQEVAEAALIPVLVKAIQELTARIEALES